MLHSAFFAGRQSLPKDETTQCYIEEILSERADTFERRRPHDLHKDHRAECQTFTTEAAIAIFFDLMTTLTQ